MNNFFKRENPDKSQEFFNKFVEVFLNTISQGYFDRETRQVEAIAMLLRQTFLFLVSYFAEVYYVTSLRNDHLNSRSKKFFDDFFEIFSYRDSLKLNTVFYILYEWKKNKIDANKIYLQSQESNRSTKRFVELISELKLEDLNELIKTNNQRICNLYQSINLQCDRLF